MVNVRAFWCDSADSKSKKHDKILMQKWNVIQLNLISSLDWIAPAKIFCMVVTGTLPQSVGFPGVTRHWPLWWESMTSSISIRTSFCLTHGLNICEIEPKEKLACDIHTGAIVPKRKAIYQWCPTEPHALAWGPTTSIQKYFSWSATDWKSMKTLSIPSKFCTYRFIAYSPTCYGDFYTVPPSKCRKSWLICPPVASAARFVVVGHVHCIGISQVDRKVMSKIVFRPNFFEIDPLIGLMWHTKLNPNRKCHGITKPNSSQLIRFRKVKCNLFIHVFIVSLIYPYGLW